MECNKEEASRAKDVAEKKMQSKDFVGARKFILKAQQLYPELENISQLLSVCDVHCAAESKSFGNDKDWYGILQVEQTADETLIKKQYRKYALLLHPDKNQFSGAEAAFKLIGEAQRILLDKEKRDSHDLKRRACYKPVFPHQQSQAVGRHPGVVRQSRPHNSFASSHFRASNFPNQGQTHQAQSANAKETFWTTCLHCSGRYEYYKDVVGRAIFCTSCKQPFVAYDMNTTKSGATQPVFPQQAANIGFQAAQKAGVSRSQKVPNKVGGTRDSRSKRRKPIGRRRKQQVESSDESSASDTSLDSEEVEEIHEAADHQRSQHDNSDGGRQTRRSNRNRRRVTYFENESDDDDDEQVVASSKKAKQNDSAEEVENASTILSSDCEEEDRIKECKADDKNEVSDKSTKSSSGAHDGPNSSVNQTQEPTVYVYPDPEFSDFAQTREISCFKTGQLWAVYDTDDCMPRFYVRIVKIYELGFKARISWLEADPNDKFGKEWVKSQLPFGCGKFKKGETIDTKDHAMFSHEVLGWYRSRNSIVIYPKVGETWATFKNWDAKWCSVPKNERKFEYEFVEILSEYNESTGARVAPLGKLKGFSNLFCRKSVNEIHIRPSEVLRFSHMVPSFRMSGNERVDVPKGSFELDPACIPPNQEEISLP